LNFAKAIDAMETRKILLIDDSEITLQMEKAVLESRGYEVRATSSLVEFEKVLQTWRPHLILTDIHMPEAQGTDICRTLKNEYHTQDIPIVLFSSLSDDELSKLAEQVGADGFLSKANGLDALGEKIDELVESILW
jgi:CheY-like chemotaxis protein